MHLHPSEMVLVYQSDLGMLVRRAPVESTFLPHERNVGDQLTE